MNAVSNILQNVKGDRTIWMVVGLLVIFSMLAVYSIAGSIAFSEMGSMRLQMTKHAVIMALGIGVMYFA